MTGQGMQPGHAFGTMTALVVHLEAGEWVYLDGMPLSPATVLAMPLKLARQHQVARRLRAAVFGPPSEPQVTA